MQFPAITYKKALKQPIGVQIPYMGDQGVASCFLEAVQLNPETAWAFVSKVCARNLDLEELQEVLGANVSYRQVLAAHITDSKNSMTQSVYIEDPKRNLRRVLHLRMVKEPDQYGPWKIYSVEQEECARTY